MLASFINILKSKGKEMFTVCRGEGKKRPEGLVSGKGVQSFDPLAA